MFVGIIIMVTIPLTWTLRFGAFNTKPNNGMRNDRDADYDSRFMDVRGKVADYLFERKNGSRNDGLPDYNPGFADSGKGKREFP